MKQQNNPGQLVVAEPDDPPKAKENNEVVVGAAVPRRIANAIKKDADDQNRTKSFVIRSILIREYDSQTAA